MYVLSELVLFLEHFVINRLPLREVSDLTESGRPLYLFVLTHFLSINPVST